MRQARNPLTPTRSAACSRVIQCAQSVSSCGVEIAPDREIAGALHVALLLSLRADAHGRRQRGRQLAGALQRGLHGDDVAVGAEAAITAVTAADSFECRCSSSRA